MFVSEAVPQHPRALKACTAQHRIHYLHHMLAVLMHTHRSCLPWHNSESCLNKVFSFGFLGLVIFSLGVFPPFRIKFCEIFACVRDSRCWPNLTPAFDPCLSSLAVLSSTHVLLSKHCYRGARSCTSGSSWISMTCLSSCVFPEASFVCLCPFFHVLLSAVFCPTYFSPFYSLLKFLP